MAAATARTPAIREAFVAPGAQAARPVARPAPLPAPRLASCVSTAVARRTPHGAPRGAEPTPAAAAKVAAVGGAFAVALVAGRKVQRRQGRGARTVLRQAPPRTVQPAELAQLRTAKSFTSADGEEFRYDTKDLLGEGAQGTVYRGVRAATGETVAIKSIPVWRFILDEDGAEKVERIDREARKQRMLGEHPNIARLHALVDVFRQGTTQHPQYKMLVMELVEGKELADVIGAGGALAEPVARHVFRQVVAGVSHIHGLSQIHRDLKPENILVTGDAASLQSQVKIIDFGVARNLAPGETFKTLAGTLSIRPPEIARAKIAYLPSSADRKVHIAKFKAPGEEYPGFGLVSRSPTGYGACLNDVEPGTQAAAQSLKDGWTITKINDTDVEDMLFQANPDDSSHAKVPKIVNMLMELTAPFTLELVEMPPREFSEKVDLWALGVVLYAALAGREPFRNDLEIIERAYDEAPLAGASTDALSLLAGLLEKDPRKRMSLAEVRAHPWVALGA